MTPQLPVRRTRRTSPLSFLREAVVRLMHGTSPERPVNDDAAAVPRPSTVAPDAQG